MSNSPAPEVLFVRLYFDRHIMARLADDLRSRGFDVLTTEEAGLDTATDEEQLAFATDGRPGHPDVQHSRLRSSPRQWLAAGRSHAGIIVSRQLGSRQYGLLLQRMLRLLNHFTAEEMTGNIVHLEQFK